MLSGPQTVGEIRTRGSRLYEFSSLEEVDRTLDSLSVHDGEPLVMKLPRQPGQKEARFAQLLAGQPEIEQMAESSVAERSARRTTDSERVAQLEEQIQALTEEVASLTNQFEEFKKQLA